jgi:hypothetical protein
VKKTLSLFFLFFAFASTAFSDAVSWKPVDNRKGYIHGYRLSDGDCFMQTVIVCRFDPDVEVTADERRSGSERFLDSKDFKSADAPLRIECVNVPVRPVSKKIASEVGKNPLKFSAVPFFPWYSNFGVTNEPENKDGNLPFYYVVASDASILYSGNSASQAAAAARSDAVKNAAGSDGLLGSFKPSIHTDLVSRLKFGESIAPVVKKLKAIANTKDGSEAQVEADNILKMLAQSKNFWYKSALISDDPAQKVTTATMAAKTFPEDKRSFEALIQKTLSDPMVAKAVKMFQMLAVYKNNLPEKKSEILKAYKLACIGEKAIAKARKDFGAKLPAVFTSLENLVMEVKAEMEARGAKQK